MSESLSVLGKGHSAIVGLFRGQCPLGTSQGAKVTDQTVRKQDFETGKPDFNELKCLSSDAKRARLGEGGQTRLGGRA